MLNHMDELHHNLAWWILIYYENRYLNWIFSMDHDIDSEAGDVTLYS